MSAISAKAPRRSPSKQVSEKEAAPMNATAAKLLVAAGDLMIERNTTDVSLSEIAQKSGVNAALVKYHFGNKDGLLLALLARMPPLRCPTLPSSSISRFHRPRRCGGISPASSMPIIACPI
jgi:AcrR family transcriptional regulator